MSYKRRKGNKGFRIISSLRERNYRFYWLGQLISQLGTWMQTVGQAWLVLQLTHSAWQLGLVSGLEFAPILFFTIFSGVLADRWPKQRILLVTRSVAMLQAFLLWGLVATGAIQLWHIYALALLLGVMNSVDQPTSSAFLVELVGRENLPNAVPLSNSLFNITRIIGPGLAGLIIAASGVPLLFLLNALSFVAVLAALLLLDVTQLHVQTRPAAETNEGEPQRAWRSLREGLGYVWRTPAIRLVTIVVGLFLLFGANFDVLLPLFATQVLNVGARGFGFLSAAIGVGSLLAALVLAWTHLRPTVGRLLAGTFIFTILEIVFAFSHSYLLSLLLIACLGGIETLFGALSVTSLQTMAPDRLRGRVVSVYILAFNGSAPLGFFLSGWLASLFGPANCLLLCALLCLLITAAAWLWRKPAERDLSDHL